MLIGDCAAPSAPADGAAGALAVALPCGWETAAAPGAACSAAEPPFDPALAPAGRALAGLRCLRLSDARDCGIGVSSVLREGVPVWRAVASVAALPAADRLRGVGCADSVCARVAMSLLSPLIVEGFSVAAPNVVKWALAHCVRGLMYLVAIAWLYVTVLMAFAETTIARGVVTFVLYGLFPLSIVMYLLGTPARRQARRTREEQAAAAVITPTDSARPDAKD